VRLLLDEDTGAHSLLSALRGTGHDVERVVDVAVLGAGASDEAVLAYASETARVLVTHNGADFAEIAAQEKACAHPGILVVRYGEGGASLDVTTLVRAIGNIASTYQTTSGMLLYLNHHVW
jgi:predicted nuclease of predicted toxin-antitoxin system